MNAADEKFIVYWKKTRPQGKLIYSLKASLWLSLPISFGSEFFRFFTAFDPALQTFSFIRVIQVFVVSFAIGFWLWGWIQWNAQENKYRQLTQQ